MKKTFLLLVIVTLCLGVTFGQTSYFGRDAGKLVAGSEFVMMNSNSAIPEFIRFSNNSTVAFAQFESWLADHFRLGEGLALKLLKAEKDGLGFTHYRYQQTYRGYPVFGNIFLVHVKNGLITCMNGQLFDKLSAPVNIVLSEADALARGLADVHANSYKWQIPDEEELLKYTVNDRRATYYPKGEMMIIPFGQGFRLTYRFDIYAHQPMSRQYVYVDASSGLVLQKIDRIYTEIDEAQVNAAATAATKYSGTRNIMTDYTGTTYRLRETGRGNGVETYNMLKGTNYGAAVDFTNATTTWTGTNANQDEVARDAHWGAEMSYDYYYNRHTRNSIDNAGMKLLSYVHYDNNYDNAFWDGQRMSYGDGSGSPFTPFTALDICGHELTHGVTENTANLTYQNESGALSEGFSDIFGTCIEFYAVPPQTPDWTMGEDIGQILRSMSNPNAYGDPDTYNGTNWYTGTGDNGGVHTNCGVLDFWFYLLCQGGSGTNDIGNAYNVTGLTMAKAERIAYRALTVYLTASSNYAAARTAAIQASSDLFGGCSPETQSTTNAWYAVGVGAAYSASPTDADFYACPTTQCAAAPFTVQFTNTTTNGNTYIWYFGDGTTSTTTNPSHTYTANGSYDVKLVANGASCGLDSITKVAYITVGPSYPCAASVPASGTGTTQTSCTGTLYDSGICEDYANNTSGTITIAPTGATSVTLTFTSFNYESGYDFLYIYDGPTTGSPQVTGSPFSGSTIPGPITSSGGSITIRQTSDAYVVGSGFILEWSCATSNMPPNTEFIADNTASCTGTIHFTDQSTNAPTSWLWKFGDGQTSTQQNPTHAYTANGTYTVTMKATNQYGTDSTIKTNYITINMPVAPTTTGASRCGTGTVTLTASGSGTLAWYDAPTGGSLVNTGNSFTTPSLSSTTSYYVENQVAGATHNCAKATNSGGGGYTSTGDHYLVFDCTVPVKLVSVKMYGNPTAAPGNRTIELRDNTGTVLQTTTVNVPANLNTITLNFNVPAGTGLRLACTNGQNIYRNNSGVAFPYTTTGFISVTSTDAGTNYYYYFYDWIIQEASCNSPRTAVTATINPMPTAPTSVSAAPPSVCGGGSTVLSATGGSGTTIRWMTGSCGGTTVGTGNNLSVTPGGTTTYYARWENTCGNSTCQNLTVSVTTAPVAPVSVSASPATICAGTATVLTATGGSGVTLNWMTDSCGGTSAGTGNNLSVTPAISTTYYARWENACGNTSCKSVPVTVNPLPVAPDSVSASPSSVCSGSSTILTVTGGSGTTLNWMTSSCGGSSVGTGNNLSVTPTLNTTYYARWENACGNSPCGDVTIILLPSPVAPSSVSATPSTLCQGTAVLLSANGGSGTTLQWVSDSCNGTLAGTGNNLNVIPGSSTTYYAYWESSSCGKSACADVTVSVSPGTVAGTASTLLNSLCAGNSTVISLSGQNGTIQWQNDAGGPWQNIPGATGVTYTTTALTSTTSYRAIVTSGLCAPTVSNSVTVSVVPGSEAGTASAPISTICSGNSTMLNLNSYMGSIQWQILNGVSWQNIPGETGVTLTTPVLTASTSFRAIVTAGGCNSDSSNAVLINVTPLSVAGVALPFATSVCTGGSTTIHLSGHTGTIQWQTDAGGTWHDISGAHGTLYATPALTTTTSFRVVVTNGICDPDTSSAVTINVNVASTAPISISGNNALCSGSGTTLVATGGIPGDGSNYEWGTGSSCGSSVISGASTDTLSTGNISATTTYWVRRIGGVCNVTTSCVFITVDVLPVPAAGITPQGPTDVCEGDYVVLEAPAGTAFQYSWSFNGAPIPGANQSVYSAFQSGSYTVEISNACGTDVSQAIVITVGNPPAPFVTLQNDTLFSSATSGNQWYLDGNPIPGATGTFWVPVTEGHYTVIVTDANGCISDVSNDIYFKPAGLDTYDDPGIIIWPNPTDGIVNIGMEGQGRGEFMLSVTDVVGRVLVKRSVFPDASDFRFTIDLSGFTRGCYFVTLENEGNSIQSKIILN